MEISGKTLHKKICQLFPDVSPSITPAVLNKICDQSSCKPFLQWFCSHVTIDNVLSEEDIRIKQYLQDSGKWLTKNLTASIEQATEDCPDLKRLLIPKAEDEVDDKSRYEREKEAFEEDWEYLQMLEESVKTLKEEEEKLNEEIEHAQTQLELCNIDVEERYKDCVDLSRDFDEVHKLLHNDVEQLINVYANAAELKGAPAVWTQMPLELCKNQIEMYINYIAAYIKRHFGNNSRDEHTNDSDYDTFMEDSRDRRGEEMLHELSACLRNLMTSRVEEASSKVSAEACLAIEELALNIYNNGNPKLPQTQAQLELEITELSGRRDFLEENVRLLRENRLEEAITQSAELTITEILVLDARLRHERREQRLTSMLRLRELTREHGHAHSDLLCMLMELQFQRVMEALEFVADARYYLSTEYSLSSTRDNVMSQLQGEYELGTVSSADRNVYNKIFTSMMNDNVNDKDSLTSSMRRLKQLVTDNKINEEKMFGVDIDEKTNRVISLEDKIDEVYNREINTESTTSSLKPMSLKISERTGEAISRFAVIQQDVQARRNQLKDKLCKNNTGFEWETLILWQRFLAHPKSLKKIYDEAQKRLEQLHFGTSS